MAHLLLRQSWHRQFVALSAGMQLLVAWWQVRLWPFRRLAGQLGQQGQVGPACVDDSALMHAREVRWVLGAWARHSPRKPTCLMLAVAGQRLLARRGVASTIYFGVSNHPGFASPTPGIAAHAWLCVGPVVVTGASEAAQFKPLAIYHLEPAPSAGQV